MGRKLTAKEYAVILGRWPRMETTALREDINEQMDELADYIRKKFFKSGGKRNPNWIVNRSGAAQNSVVPMRAKISGSRITAGVKGGGTSARHFPFLEHGTTGPYIITPRRPGGFLRFETESGEVVYTRRVVHPGIRARAPIGRGVAQRQTAIIQALIQKHGRRLRKQFG